MPKITEDSDGDDEPALLMARNPRNIRTIDADMGEMRAKALHDAAGRFDFHGALELLVRGVDADAPHPVSRRTPLGTLLMALNRPPAEIARPPGEAALRDGGMAALAALAAGVKEAVKAAVLRMLCPGKHGAALASVAAAGGASCAPTSSSAAAVPSGFLLSNGNARRPSRVVPALGDAGRGAEALRVARLLLAFGADPNAGPLLHKACGACGVPGSQGPSGAALMDALLRAGADPWLDGAAPLRPRASPATAAAALAAAAVDSAGTPPGTSAGSAPGASNTMSMKGAAAAVPEERRDGRSAFDVCGSLAAQQSLRLLVASRDSSAAVGWASVVLVPATQLALVVWLASALGLREGAAVGVALHVMAWAREAAGLVDEPPPPPPPHQGRPELSLAGLLAERGGRYFFAFAVAAMLGLGLSAAWWLGPGAPPETLRAYGLFYTTCAVLLVLLRRSDPGYLLPDADGGGGGGGGGGDDEGDGNGGSSSSEAALEEAAAAEPWDPPSRSAKVRRALALGRCAPLRAQLDGCRAGLLCRQSGGGSSDGSGALASSNIRRQQPKVMAASPSLPAAKGDGSGPRYRGSGGGGSGGGGGGGEAELDAASRTAGKAVAVAVAAAEIEALAGRRVCESCVALRPNWQSSSGAWQPQQSQLVQLPGARHCGPCGRCVIGHDHHCLWLGVCVGAGNRRLFVALLACLLAAAFFQLRLLALFVVRACAGGGPGGGPGGSLEGHVLGPCVVATHPGVLLTHLLGLLPMAMALSLLGGQLNAVGAAAALEARLRPRNGAGGARGGAQRDGARGGAVPEAASGVTGGGGGVAARAAWTYGSGILRFLVLGERERCGAIRRAFQQEQRGL